MIIAVDFDGTIVKHEYPQIGAELPFAIKTLQMLQNDGHILILWTVREGKLLDEAVKWCKDRGVEFYSVNSNFSEETEKTNGFSRKLKADLFIDDRNFGGFPGWANIYHTIKEGRFFKLDFDTLIDLPNKPQKRKGFFSRLFS